MIYDSSSLKALFPSNSELDAIHPLNIPYPILYNCWDSGKGIAIVENKRDYSIKCFRWVPTWYPKPPLTISYCDWFTVFRSPDIGEVISTYREFCKELLGFKPKNQDFIYGV